MERQQIFRIVILVSIAFLVIFLFATIVSSAFYLLHSENKTVQSTQNTPVSTQNQNTTSLKVDRVSGLATGTADSSDKALSSDENSTAMQLEIIKSNFADLLKDYAQ